TETSIDDDCSDVIKERDIPRAMCTAVNGCFVRDQTSHDLGICYLKKVHGGWTQWSRWGGLIGSRRRASRTRQCHQPPPMRGGRQCLGSSTDTRSETHRISEYPKQSAWSYFHEVIDSIYMTQYSREMLAERVSRLQCVLKCAHSKKCQKPAFIGETTKNGLGNCYALKQTTSTNGFEQLPKFNRDQNVVMTVLEEQPL
uniref:Uncharacterized protein n=1 Tax=Clytia hemisphaerica TaxID=252671 RepID=A0A7M5WT14_9CNID